MKKLHNLYKYKNNNNINNNINKEKFQSFYREWKNSIYSFNKNYLSLLPEVNKLTMELIIAYFKSINKNLEKKIRKFKIRLNYRDLSSNKFYVSKGLFKHTNDKLIITLFIYNRQKTNYSYFIERKFKYYLSYKLIYKLNSIKIKVNEALKQEYFNRLIVLNKFRPGNTFLYENESIIIYKKLINRILKKYRSYYMLKKLLYINKSKLNYRYLTYISYMLKKLYKKNIAFEIVNLKNFYLNSDIFTDSILLKVKKDRKTLVKRLKRLIFKSKTTTISKFIRPKYFIKNNIKDTEHLINKIVLSNLYELKKKSVKKTVLSLIKYKKVTGVRIQAKGRLTRRFTASRSLYQYKYKGNLRNIDSSYMGLTSALLRGYFRSNLQYTNINSNTRVGSFGLKGWVSSY